MAGSRSRSYSSTRGDFLDLPGNFLSAGSSTAISEMSDRDYRCRVFTCEVCGTEVDAEKCTVCAEVEGNPLGKYMLKALNKIENLSQQVHFMNSELTQQNRRLSRLEINSGAEWW